MTPLEHMLAIGRFYGEKDDDTILQLRELFESRVLSMFATLEIPDNLVAEAMEILASMAYRAAVEDINNLTSMEKH